MEHPKRLKERRKSAIKAIAAISAISTPVKRGKGDKSDESDNEGHTNFSVDQLEEALKSIPSEKTSHPTELNSIHDVGGGEIYGLLKSPKKKQMVDLPNKLSFGKELKINMSKLDLEKYCKDKAETKTPEKSEPEKPKCPSPRRLRSGKPRVAGDYHFKPDDYFSVQSEKCKTSENTLSKIKNNLDQETLKRLLENSNHVSKDHKEIIKNLTKNLEDSYTEWIQLMEEGFSVLLYGVGSKRLLINNFKKIMIPDEPALIINGFFPSLTLKDILDNIIEDLMGLSTPSNQSECFEIIEKTMKMYPDECMYLLIHNIDGVMLRSNKVQDTLSRLANIPNIHLLASVDHINAPLIWDNVMRAKFNFYWVDATTFLPYEAETSYEGSLLVKQSGALALQSLQSVFASLTKNAKFIYIHLVKFQLENSKSNYNGMPFKDLYRASRENFWVSTDVALRALLTEFLDHKLIKNKRSSDGVEYLMVPLDDSLLKQFLEKYDVEM